MTGGRGAGILHETAMINPLRLCALAAALALTPAARADQGPAAGDFSNYLFVLEWEPQFCTTVSGAPECAALTTGSFAATYPVLHGLWPDQAGDTSDSYGYCGAAIAQKPLDHASTWCQMTLPPLSDATRASLDKYMPGTKSCLEHHEWERHGTCSGLSADAYFGAETGLAAAVDGSSFGAYVAQHAGGLVDRDSLLAQFDAAFGAGTSASVTVHCASSNGEAYLTEIHITLKPALFPPDQLADMLTAPEASDATNCPASIRLLPAAR
jgi:ribonuclease T2